jgi:pimeloyl-ACP methyl ester carboxylesterase
VEAVTLLGLRFGATVASLAAERFTDIDRLVLWAPIVDGERYMQELLRMNVATQTAVYKEVRHDRSELVELMRLGQTVNVDGYEMNHAFFAEASAIRLAAAKKTHRGPCLVVQIDRQAARPSGELKALAATYPGGTLAMATEEPFWKEGSRFYDRAPELFSVTADWLRAAQ